MTRYKAYIALAMASWTAELPDILGSSGYLVGGGVGTTHRLLYLFVHIMCTCYLWHWLHLRWNVRRMLTV